MKIKDLVKLKKLLLEYCKEFHYGDKDVSALGIIIISIEKKLDKIHKNIIEHEWKVKPR